MSEKFENNKAALVLGGSRGIGAYLVKELSNRYRTKKIYIVDCNEPYFRTDNCEYINLNLSYQSLDTIKNLDIDTLIITAGIGRLSEFKTFSTEEIRKNFFVNTFPAIELISAYYHSIYSKQNFNCCVVSSIAGIIASPLYSVYSASKASLIKFTEAVNAELAYNNFNNRILNIAPGRIEGTNFHSNTDTSMNKDSLSDLASQIIDKMLMNEELFIPQYNETYSRVIKEYQSDNKQFALNSLKYKLQNTKLNNIPQIKIGYLTGTFDLFHIGHLNLLKNAKKFCDKLIVGVHPDAKHKNKEVFIPLEERIEILKNIRFIDEVIICSDEDIDDYPKLKYDFLFVGTDYQGSERFNRYEKYFADKNVKIVYLPYTKSTSSTQIRSAITAKITQA